jgi:hypothetical protein
MALPTPHPANSGEEKHNVSKALENIFKALDPSSSGQITSRDFSRVLDVAGIKHHTSPRQHQALLVRYRTQHDVTHIDYEKLLLDGQCIQLRGVGDDIVPPVEPWAEEKKKRTRNPPPLANATKDSSVSHWEAHGITPPILLFFQCPIPFPLLILLFVGSCLLCCGV